MTINWEVKGEGGLCSSNLSEYTERTWEDNRNSRKNQPLLVGVVLVSFAGVLEKA